jgi:hypothetical protein
MRPSNASQNAPRPYATVLLERGGEDDPFESLTAPRAYRQPPP